MGGIWHAGRGEPFLPQATGIAAATGLECGIGLVAGHRLGVIHPQPQAFRDDPRLRPVDERRVNAEPRALDARLTVESQPGRGTRVRLTFNPPSL